jgi:hypothetical protein
MSYVVQVESSYISIQKSGDGIIQGGSNIGVKNNEKVANGDIVGVFGRLGY